MSLTEEYDALNSIEATKHYNYVLQRPPTNLNAHQLAQSYLLSINEDELALVFLKLKKQFSEEDWKDLVL